MLREFIIKRFTRSSKWPKVRKEFLKDNNKCSVCGNKRSLEVHHILPVRLAPELELDKSNLITLCRKKRCHLLFGHLNDWSTHNPKVVDDAEEWNVKIKVGKLRRRPWLRG